MAHTPESALIHYKKIGKERDLLMLVFLGALGLFVAVFIFVICAHFIWHLNAPGWVSVLSIALWGILSKRCIDRVKTIEDAMLRLNNRYDLKQDDHLGFVLELSIPKKGGRG